MSHGKYWTEAEQATMTELKAQGLGYEKIARRMGRSSSCVYARWRPLPERKTYRPVVKPPALRLVGALELAKPYDPLHDNPRMQKILGAK